VKARRTWFVIVGTLALATLAVFAVFGERTGIILGRIGLAIF
jgi:hypothetical protein